MVKSVSRIDYMESSQIYTSNYLRSSKAVGVLWGVFTFCFAIIDVVVFIQPQWIGDTVESKGTGYFGLWKHCSLIQGGQEIICKGQLEDFSTISNPAFRAATVFVGLSVVTILICICSMLFFFFFNSSTVFHICGWLQMFSGAFLIVGVLAFPAGWDDPSVQEICGPASRDFYPGQCGLRWAYILAMIGVADILVLSALAFTLAVRHVKLLSLQPYPVAAIYKGESNHGYISDERRRSVTAGPNQMMMVPRGGSASGSGVAVPVAASSDINDRMSEYSHRTHRSQHSTLAYRPEYATTGHQFRL